MSVNVRVVCIPDRHALICTQHTPQTQTKQVYGRFPSHTGADFCTNVIDVNLPDYCGCSTLSQSSYEFIGLWSVDHFRIIYALSSIWQQEQIIIKILVFILL